MRQEGRFSRQQPLRLSLEEAVGQGGMARLVDRFAEVFDLRQMKFTAPGDKATGRPAYSAEVLCRMIDGSKFCASNNKRTNFSRKKGEERLNRIDEQIAAYLEETAWNDRTEKALCDFDFIALISLFSLPKPPFDGLIYSTCFVS